MTPPPKTDEALLPCPFCGGASPSVTYRNGWIVMCVGSCSGRTGFYPEKKLAIQAWNTRVPSPTAPVSDEMVEAACEAYDGAADDGAASTADAAGMRAALVRFSALSSAAKSAPVSASAWVACEERMPGGRRYVLAWCPERRMAFQASHEDGAWWPIGGGRIWEEITHWMPTPTMELP